MGLKSLWERLRYRNCRKDVVAFTLGLEVGRILSTEDADKLKKRVGDHF